MTKIQLLVQSLGYLFWIIAYLLIIKRGFQNRTYGLPLLALVLNISWEIVQTVLLPFFPENPYPWFGAAWFGLLVILILDIIINGQYLKFGIRYDVARKINPPLLSAANSKLAAGITYALVLLVSLGLQITFTLDFVRTSGDFIAAANYSGLVINLIDSMLFIKLLTDRGNLDGQSIYIAIFKMLGTFMSIVATPLAFLSPLLLYCAILVFIFDWIYIIMVYRRAKVDAINPWARC